MFSYESTEPKHAPGAAHVHVHRFAPKLGFSLQLALRKQEAAASMSGPLVAGVCYITDIQQLIECFCCCSLQSCTRLQLPAGRL